MPIALGPASQLDPIEYLTMDTECLTVDDTVAPVGGVVFSVCKSERVVGSLQQDPINLSPASTRTQWRWALLEPLKLGPAPGGPKTVIFFPFSYGYGCIARPSSHTQLNFLVVVFSDLNLFFKINWLYRGQHYSTFLDRSHLYHLHMHTHALFSFVDKELKLINARK
jgi:hypothetical protein